MGFRESKQNVVKNKIILGTVQLGLPYGINNTTGQPNLQEAAAILNAAQANGIDTLDTANAYGSSEEIIGTFHKGNPAHKFNIITKFSLKDDGDIRLNAVNTLNTLNIESIDTYMYHKFSDLFYKAENTTRELEALKHDGLIRKTGVSVYTNAELLEAIDFDFIDVIQLPFNLLDNYVLRGREIEKAKQKGKEIHVRSVFLQGLFFMDEQDIPAKLLPLKSYIYAIRKIAEEANISISTLALNYVLAIKSIDKVLIGVDSLSQLESNVQSIHTKIDSVVFELINKIKVEETDLLNPVNWK